jgi:hypothetical protein
MIHTHFTGLSKPWIWIMQNVEISNPIQEAGFGPFLRQKDETLR